jgi:DNA repair exonuclease SbcCD nuclease subunit
MNWVQKIGVEENCTAFVCLGDFFDKPQLNAEEISALHEVNWSHWPQYFIVGNHEMFSSDLRVNSANLFNLMPNATAITVPTIICDNVLVLPYILNSNRKPLKEYFVCDIVPSVILSHNDIAGIQMGSFLSKDGFTIDEINEFGGLFINGHLHNGAQFSKLGYNIGNVCGQNFSEDAFLYKHKVWVIDTDTCECSTYINPYALNFYKIDFTVDNSIEYINEVSSNLSKNSVVTVKCKEEDLDYIKARFGTEEDPLIPRNCNIVEARFIVEYDVRIDGESKKEALSVDHLQQFSEYVKSTIGANDIIIEELNEVLK